MRPYALLTALLLGTILLAQTPEAFNYQGVARDAGGDALANTAIGVQFQLHQGTAVGTVVYSETHSPTTNELGLFSLEVGNGTPGTGTFAAIDWSAGPYFLEVGLDPAGGSSYTSVGTQQLLSVPYALHAKTADMADDGDWVLSGDTVHSNGRRVGIGTSAPTHLLNVKRNGQGFSQNSANDNVRVGTYTDNNNAYIQTHSDHPLHFATNNALAQVSLLQNGDLGIGTTTPEARLDVAGTFKLSDGTQGDKKVLTSDADGNASWQELSAESLLGVGNVPPALSNDISCTRVVGSLGLGSSPTSLAVDGSYAYVLTSNGGLFSDELEVIDLSDPSSPTLSGSFEGLFDPRSVAVSGNYAYVVTGNGYLKVIDVNDPAAPVASDSLFLGGGAIAVAVSNNYAYVVGISSDDLKVIDISIPSTPVLIGSLGLGPYPLHIAVSGNYAYVVDQTSDDMKVIDISTPASPVLSGSLAIGSTPVFITASGNHAYVVDVGTDDLKVIDISDPAAPALAGSLVVGGGPRSVAVLGEFAYVVDVVTNDLKVIDVSDPASLVLSSSIGIGATPSSIAISGDHAHVVDLVPELKVFELFCPTGQQQLMYDPGTGAFVAAEGWQVNADTLYTLDKKVGIGISDPSSLLGGTDLGLVDDAGEHARFTMRSNAVRGLVDVRSTPGVERMQLGSVSAHPLSFFTSGSLQMTLDTNGFLGIGTATPAHGLDLRADGQAFGHRSLDSTIAIGTYVDNTYGAFLQTHTDHPLQFATNNGDAQMTLLQNGNVGIGTTTPIRPLHVAQGSGNPNVVLVEATGSPQAYLRFNDANTTNNGNQPYIGSQGDAFTINTGGAEAIRVEADKDVQVNGYTKLGTDAPAIKQKVLTGSFPNAGGFINVAHGLTRSKILSVDILVDFAGSSYPPEQLQAGYFVTSTDVRITSYGTSPLPNGVPLKVLVTYMQ